MLEAEVVSEFAGYVCRYTPTIMSGPVFRWTLKNDRSATRFEVSASRDGVVLSGNSPTLPPEAVYRLVQVIDLAEDAHRWLADRHRTTEQVKELIRNRKPLPEAA